ncbi:M48 family metallopeptidase [Cellulophaga baltica]|uniref:M48 family metallopeptidase n=1 Tax=Cellulophaga baltica TaxID=76594 RepID=UPI0015F486BD|nr:SprT family zinc-dependent metalloprotease [Cellulophaga baltica]MBA6315174.1 M48 family metallopeptidase [Cellulophaga baltica]
MSIKTETIAFANVEVEIMRKDIKNMHLAVYPPNGAIKLSVPTKTDDEVVRLFAISKLGWIKKNVKNFKKQARETKRDYVSGESHYFKGQRYLLNVHHHNGYKKVEITGTNKIQLWVKPTATVEEKATVIKEWYRKELKSQIPELLKKWEKIIGVQSDDWGVKQMKTKWGACNVDAKRIWLNLELAKKPTICLEYILVHELVHLHERNHNTRFISLMNQFMPKWRMHRDELNSLPIVHNDWGY